MDAEHIGEKCFAPTPGAVRSEFTSARGGLIYRYTNDGNSLQGAAVADVSFTSGSTVEGENVAGQRIRILPAS